MKAPSLLFAASLLMFATSAHAEYLFADPNGYFPIPEFALQSGIEKEYSEWDVFSAPHTEGNYPDVAAPHGGVLVGGVWQPVQRSTAGFPANNPIYNPDDPLAFWDTRNATIKQTGTTSAFIISRTARETSTVGRVRRATC